MTRASAVFLLYLDRYLDQDKTRVRELRTLYEKHTGKKLSDTQLWRHTKRKGDPNQSTTLVYQIFLHKAGHLIPAKEPGDVFHYKNEAWLKAKK